MADETAADYADYENRLAADFAAARQGGLRITRTAVVADFVVVVEVADAGSPQRLLRQPQAQLPLKTDSATTDDVPD